MILWVDIICNSRCLVADMIHCNRDHQLILDELRENDLVSYNVKETHSLDAIFSALSLPHLSFPFDAVIRQHWVALCGLC